MRSTSHLHFSTPRAGRDSATAADRLDAIVVLATSALTAPPGAVRDFQLRRASSEAEGLATEPGVRTLQRALAVFQAQDSAPELREGALLEWAGELEARGHLPHAARVLDAAIALLPDRPELLLGRARVARKAGDRVNALRFYRAVRAATPDASPLAGQAQVGEAMLDDEPVAALTKLLDDSRDGGDAEARAVAFEARARLRWQGGDSEAAVRDFLAAAVGYDDPLDHGRLGIEVADLLVLAGDPLSARVVLLTALDCCHPRQRDLLRARLRTVALTMRDEVGARRWDGPPGPQLVPICLSRRASWDRSGVRADRVARLLERVAGS